MTITDQLNRTLLFNSTPKRIVCLVPSLTELLVDLGLEDNLVGITKFCVHPKYLKQNKQIVGGTKQVHFDKIEDLKPDIIICNKEENTKDIVLQCEAICNVHVSNLNTLDDVYNLINQYGQLFNCQTKALSIITTIKDNCVSFLNDIKHENTINVAYFIWKNPYMVAGNNTFINYLLKLNKLNNVFNNLERYPEVGLSSLQEKNVNLILLSSEPYPFKDKHIKEIKNEVNANVILVDGEMFSWYGSRLIHAFAYFKSLRQRINSIAI